MAETATLTFRGKTYQLPVIIGSEGEVAFDIAKLRAESGAITLDPSFGNSGACLSGITFIDGEKGILRYRGYPIEQLAEKATFLQTAYLLIYGELPSSKEFEKFRHTLIRHTLIHEDMRRIFDAFPPDAHPMAIISSVVSGLSTD